MRRTVTKSRTAPDTVDERIVTGIERLAHCVRILLWDAAKQGQLSPLQIQLLIFLNTHPEDRCRISSLAREFDLSRPTVSGAMAVLSGKGLVSKRVSQSDRRFFTMQLTRPGRKLAAKLADWPSEIARQLGCISPHTREIAAGFLTELIALLQQAGVITVARMCTTCAHFLKGVHIRGDKPHHCKLTDRPIAGWELQFDCNSHQQSIGEKPRRNERALSNR